MARRKSHHKRKTHRRRKSHMGSTGGNFTTMLSMVAGAVAGRILQTKLQDKVNPKLLAGGQVVAGMFLPKLVKSKIGAGIGAGMVVNGGVTLLNSFGVISAISGDGATVSYEDESMSGSADIQTIAGNDDMGYTDYGTMSGSSDISVIAGDEDFDY
jgi:hypothetical protein